jgi:Raf kinase inhibitor-like YbhB/YbcL family protein
MKVWSDSFADGGTIPDTFAFCVPAPVGHVTFGPNRSPHLAWDDAPQASRSFVVTCVDPTAPTVGDDVNKEGRTVPASLPRGPFVHWVLIDLPRNTRVLAEGAWSDGVTQRGKGPLGPDAGVRTCQNDYTGWFTGNPDMAGRYYGYDGPAPPWNDELVHRYVFTVYATDFDIVPVEGDFSHAAVMKVLEGHILAQASIEGTYTLTATLRR